MGLAGILGKRLCTPIDKYLPSISGSQISFPLLHLTLSRLICPVSHYPRCCSLPSFLLLPFWLLKLRLMGLSPVIKLGVPFTKGTYLVLSFLASSRGEEQLLTFPPRYQGYSPSSSPPSIQRQWTDGYNPITSVTSAKMLCNGGTSAALSAEIAAGTAITAKWAQWTHQQGPVMVWMYKCAGEFSACDGKGKGWFKIDQTGLTAPPISGTNWGTNIVYTKLAYTSTIPKSLAPGNYLIRHELLALHQANAPQFYPECAQLKVTGTGTASPAASFLTTIPGYATANDPGVMVSCFLRRLVDSS